MKKFVMIMALCYLLVVAFSSVGFAGNTMIINFKNGQKQNVNLDTVQNIEFSGGDLYGTGYSRGPSSGRAYEMIAKHSGKCLDISGAAMHNGANIHQWDCHEGANQRWILTDKGNGYYTVKAKHSNKCMDVEGANNGNGVNISQYDCHGGSNQLWLFTPQGEGYFKVTAKHSGKCLDVSGGNKNNGDNVHQWDCHGGDNQIWLLK